MPRRLRTPVVVGLTAVGLAVTGLSIVLYATYVGVRDAHVVRHLYPTLTADALIVVVPALLLVAGLLTGAGLVLAGRAGGRSALVWLCTIGTAVALLLFGGHVVLLRNWNFAVWIGPPEWIGALGGLLALVALVGAAVSLGVPSARQALPAITAGAATTGGGPPAPLRAAASRFAAGGALGVAGLAPPLVLMFGGMAVHPFVVGFVLVAGGGLVAGAIGAHLAAVAARTREPNAAARARVFGVLMLLVQLLSLYLGAWIAGADLRPDGLGNAVLVGGPALVAAVAGVVATLGGFAGLADPHSERFLRPRSGAAEQGRQSWTPAGPRPMDDPAPAEGYTVP